MAPANGGSKQRTCGVEVSDALDIAAIRSADGAGFCGAPAFALIPESEEDGWLFAIN